MPVSETSEFLPDDLIAPALEIFDIAGLRTQVFAALPEEGGESAVRSTVVKILSEAARQSRETIAREFARQPHNAFPAGPARQTRFV